MSDDKNRLRPEMRLQCRRRMPGWNTLYRQIVAEETFQRVWEILPRGGTVAVYHPLVDEVDCGPLAALLRDGGYGLVLPCFSEQKQPMVFRLWDGSDNAHDSQRIHMPPAGAPVHDPDLVIMPMLGFNAGRYRLGRGGGHYDITLATMPHVATIGLAAGFQKIVFDAEPHDRPLDRIITERGVVLCKRGAGAMLSLVK